MSEIENLLKNSRLVKINNQLMLQGRTKGIITGRGASTVSKVDFFMKKKTKICLENDTIIYCKPKIKVIQNEITNELDKLIRGHINISNNVVIKGWINMNNVVFEEHSKL